MNIFDKIVERTIASVLVPHFDRAGVFGRDQRGFRKKRSGRDLDALLVCRWVVALDNGFKLDIYLLNIFKAFGHVDQDVVDDIRRYGASSCLFRFLFNYLASRQATR